MYATYHKTRVRVKVTILLGTMMKNGNNVRNLFMVDVWATIISFKLVKNVNTFVYFLILWVNKIVNIVFFSMIISIYNFIQMLVSNLSHLDLVKAIIHVGFMINLHERVRCLIMVVVKEIKIIS